jgi:hypothetical protein
MGKEGRKLHPSRFATAKADAKEATKYNPAKHAGYQPQTRTHRAYDSKLSERDL